jgi:hypothetical protein
MNDEVSTKTFCPLYPVYVTRFLQQVFPDRLKYSEIEPLFKVIKQVFLFTGPFPSAFLYVKLLKRLHTKDYMII